MHAYSKNKCTAYMHVHTHECSVIILHCIAKDKAQTGKKNFIWTVPVCHFLCKAEVENGNVKCARIFRR